jgi:hypothetical protein
MPKSAAVLTIDRKSAGEYWFDRSEGSVDVNSGQEALANAKACAGVRGKVTK